MGEIELGVKEREDFDFTWNSFLFDFVLKNGFEGILENVKNYHFFIVDTLVSPAIFLYFYLSKLKVFSSPLLSMTQDA